MIRSPLKIIDLKIRLGSGNMEYKIYYYDKLESTNDKAKELADKLEEGNIILAKEQTKGKGRLGKRWYSTKGKSISMSMILRPKIKAKDIEKITLITSVAINMALKDIGIESQIKWPNDIVIGNKKVCGILTEINVNFSKINYVIVGIGINVNQNPEDIPKEILHKSTSLKIIGNKNIDKKIVLQNILNRFKEYYMPFKSNGNINKVIELSKKHSVVIGKKVLVIQGRNKRKAKAIDINNKGELILEFPEGVEKINSGEISLRGIEGYID